MGTEALQRSSPDGFDLRCRPFYDDFDSLGQFPHCAGRVSHPYGSETVSSAADLSQLDIPRLATTLLRQSVPDFLLGGRNANSYHPCFHGSEGCRYADLARAQDPGQLSCERGGLLPLLALRDLQYDAYGHSLTHPYRLDADLDQRDVVPGSAQRLRVRLARFFFQRGCHRRCSRGAWERQLVSPSTRVLRSSLQGFPQAPRP